MKQASRILFILIILELILGGGGRLTAFGTISLRMVLFCLALIFSGYFYYVGRKLPVDYVKFLVVFSISLIIGIVIGILSGAKFVLLKEDVKPLLYFLILPFFAFVIDMQLLMSINKIVKVSSVILAIAFFVILILIHTSAIPFLSFYAIVIDTQEFFFRGEFTFFYKAFLFLGIGSIFFSLTPSKNKSLFLSLLIGAIVLTLTRGLLLALLLTYTVYYFQKLLFVRASLFLFVSALILFGSQSFIGRVSQFISEHRSTARSSTTLLGDRQYSDQGRLQQIKEVASSVSPLSFFVGHGFGNGVFSRPVHMEISYLEIFHKQGIVGLAMWTYLLWLLFVRWKTGISQNMKDAFFFSSLFIFFQSLTNQYINNPIGLSWILLCLVCLDTLNNQPNNFTH